MNFWYEDHRILVYLNLTTVRQQRNSKDNICGEILHTESCFVVALKHQKEEALRTPWAHLYIRTYYWILPSETIWAARAEADALIWNLQLLTSCKRESRQKIMQGKPIYLFSSTVSLSVSVIGGCQHYDRVSSRNNWRRHFPWWVWSSQTGKDAVGLLHICGVQSLGLTSQTGFHIGKRKTALWTLGMWRCIQPENHLSLLPASSWHWLPMPFLLMKTNGVKFREQSFWELLTLWVSGRLESLPKAPCTLMVLTPSQGKHEQKTEFRRGKQQQWLSGHFRGSPHTSGFFWLWQTSQLLLVNPLTGRRMRRSLSERSSDVAVPLPACRYWSPTWPSMDKL